MGDFLVDFRPPSERRLADAAAFLKFFPDMRVSVLEEEEFGLVLTSPDEPRLWEPARSLDGNHFAGLCGRVALESNEWREAQDLEGLGGAACKHILKCYGEGGIDRVALLNGNFVILIHDADLHRFFVITDRWGLMPAFQWNAGGQAVLSSHPDALADSAGESRNWDLTSFAEFILTAKVSYPFSYYRRIQALPFASVTTFALNADQAVAESTNRYFEFQFDPWPIEKLDELADELAAGFRKSVAKRTLPAVGRSAIALSGGLDSRTVLCAAPQNNDLLTFSCFDEENEEFRIARAIARAAGAKFVPLRRSPDFYAESAALGAKISAGMGCIASNHFLGFRKEFNQLGINNLLTGCYCDYLFKGLGLNRRVNPWTTRESLGAFDFSYYAAHFPGHNELGAAVRQRLQARFPSDLRRFDTEARVAEVHHRRLFPLCYEEDNAERTIPQRVMGWYPPIAENDLLDAHLKMSSAMKLNRELFALTVKRICGPGITRIPDANTGLPLDGSTARVAIRSHGRRLKSLARRLMHSPSTHDSWLNWRYYVDHSQAFQSLWTAPHRDADEIFTQVLGKEGFSRETRDYRGTRLWILIQLFTLKLWLDQRQ